MRSAPFALRTATPGDSAADSFGLFSRDAVYDPHPLYHRLRKREPDTSWL